MKIKVKIIDIGFWGKRKLKLLIGTQENINAQLKWYRQIPLSGEDYRMAKELSCDMYMYNIRPELEYFMNHLDEFYPPKWKKTPSWRVITREAWFILDRRLLRDKKTFQQMRINHRRV